MRYLVAAGLVVLGAVTGLAATALHALWWGLLLAVSATAATVVALRPGWGRVPFAAGWVVMVAYLAMPRGEGDYVIGQDLPGYLLLGTGLVLVVATLSTLPAPRRVRESADPDS